uniref:Uncharacterized protein n=1 Tax=Megaviridae environmental sample TaxID=1737588 RepID=A0A5J6VIE4_9VIRU|nr:MAG: hypothetical protein [Megaviridae environmental sample]
MKTGIILLICIIGIVLVYIYYDDISTTSVSTPTTSTDINLDNEYNTTSTISSKSLYIMIDNYRYHSLTRTVELLEQESKTIQVKLTEVPTTDVYVIINNTSDAMINLDVNELLFTVDNYTEFQTITATAVAGTGGIIQKNIQLQVSSDDIEYNDIKSIDFNIEFLPSSILIDDKEIRMLENTEHVLKFNLSDRQDGDVQISIDGGEGELDITPRTLWIYQDEWMNQQEVTITAPTVNLGNKEYSIVISSMETEYSPTMHAQATIYVIDEDPYIILTQSDGMPMLNNTLETNIFPSYTLSLSKPASSNISVEIVNEQEIRDLGVFMTPSNNTLKTPDDIFSVGIINTNKVEFTIEHILSGSGTGYDGMRINVMIKDEIIPEITFAPITINKNTNQGDLKVIFNKRPTDSLEFSMNNDGEFIVLQKSEIRVTNNNNISTITIDKMLFENSQNLEFNLGTIKVTGTTNNFDIPVSIRCNDTEFNIMGVKLIFSTQVCSLSSTNSDCYMFVDQDNNPCAFDNSIPTCDATCSHKMFKSYGGFLKTTPLSYQRVSRFPDAYDTTHEYKNEKMLSPMVGFGEDNNGKKGKDKLTRTYAVILDRKCDIRDDNDRLRCISKSKNMFDGKKTNKKYNGFSSERRDCCWINDDNIVKCKADCEKDENVDNPKPITELLENHACVFNSDDELQCAHVDPKKKFIYAGIHLQYDEKKYLEILGRRCAITSDQGKLKCVEATNMSNLPDGDFKNDEHKKCNVVDGIVRCNNDGKRIKDVLKDHYCWINNDGYIECKKLKAKRIQCPADSPPLVQKEWVVQHSLYDNKKTYHRSYDGWIPFGIKQTMKSVLPEKSNIKWIKCLNDNCLDNQFIGDAPTTQVYDSNKNYINLFNMYSNLSQKSNSNIDGGGFKGDGSPPTDDYMVLNPVTQKKSNKEYLLNHKYVPPNDAKYRKKGSGDLDRMIYIDSDDKYRTLSEVLSQYDCQRTKRTKKGADKFNDHYYLECKNLLVGESGIDLLTNTNTRSNQCTVK